jgi:hypothetical protein
MLSGVIREQGPDKPGAGYPRFARDKVPDQAVRRLGRAGAFQPAAVDVAGAQRGLGQVDPAAAKVFADVADKVRQLKGQPRKVQTTREGRK